MTQIIFRMKTKFYIDHFEDHSWSLGVMKGGAKLFTVIEYFFFARNPFDVVSQATMYAQ